MSAFRLMCWRNCRVFPTGSAMDRWRPLSRQTHEFGGLSTAQSLSERPGKRGSSRVPRACFGRAVPRNCLPERPVTVRNRNQQTVEATYDSFHKRRKWHPRVVQPNDRAGHERKSVVLLLCATKAGQRFKVRFQAHALQSFDAFPRVKLEFRCSPARCNSVVTRVASVFRQPASTALPANQLQTAKSAVPCSEDRVLIDATLDRELKANGW